MRRQSRSPLLQRLFHLFFVGAAIWMGPWAHAATIQAVQGQKVMVNLGSDSATEGDLLVALSPEGKKLGIIRLQKVRGGKAIGQIVKGRAEKGWEAVARTAVASRKKPKKTDFSKPKSKSAMIVGALGGFMMDSQTTKLGSDLIGYESVALSGYGFSGHLFMDYPLTEAISVRLMGGIETFNTAGTATNKVCGTEGKPGTSDCISQIMYLSGGGIARYTFQVDQVGIWIGAAVFGFYPLSANTNTIKQVFPTNSVGPAIGLDYNLNPDFFLTVQGEYGIFLAGLDLKAMGGRGGIGYRF